MHQKFPARRTRLARAAATLGFALSLQSALAQDLAFDIPSQPLPSALAAFARQTGLQLAFPPELVQGRQGRRVSGSRDLRSALDELLSGTGLQGQVQGKTLVIQPVPAPGAARATLAEVTVTASAERSAASEGTGSYAVHRSSASTGLDLSMQETPQSVTVVTRQQMDDQALNSVQAVLERAVGVHLNQNDSERAYPSIRGFSVPALLLDGTPLPAGGDNLFGYAYLLQDSASYDRVEVVRGAAGLLNGVGTPAGAIHLIRKKPTRNFQASMQVNVGSWDRYRSMVDISSPLNQEGTLRGRLVTAYQDRQSFIDYYRQKRTDVYAVLEADLTPATLLTVGAEQITNNADAPSWGPLPLFLRDGTAYDAPRSRNPGVKWGRFDTTTRSLSAELQHRFDNDWTVKLSARRLDHHREQDLVSGSYDWPRYDGSGVRANASQGPDSNQTTVINVSASGSFALAGRRHQAHVGAYYSHIDGHSDVYYSAANPGRALYLDIPDFFRWNNDFAHPTQAHWGYWYRQTRQLAAHGALQLRVSDALTLIPGARLTSYKDSSHRYLGDGSYGWGSDKQERRVFTPFLGAVYELSRHLSLYASYTDIFTPQTALDVNGHTLDPIVGHNFELGAKGTLPGTALQGSIAFFRTEEKNNAQADGDRTTPAGTYASATARACNRRASNWRSRASWRPSGISTAATR